MKVKVAILDQTDISPEMYCQHFLREGSLLAARSQAVAQHLQDYAWQWLEPDKQFGTQVVEAAILYQFIQFLLAGGKEWVHRHCPMMLTEMVGLMEDYLEAETVEPQLRNPEEHRGKPHQAPLEELQQS